MKSTELKSVYSLYGKCMEQCQIFEATLGFLIIFTEMADSDREYDNNPTLAEEISDLPIGLLRDRLQEVVPTSLPSKFKEKLNASKQVRDYLAHEFFIVHMQDRLDGRIHVMKEDLEDFLETLKKNNKIFNRYACIAAKDAGVEIPDSVEGAEELLEA